MKKIIGILVCICVSISFASAPKVSASKPRVKIQWYFDFLSPGAHHIQPTLHEIMKTNQGVSIAYKPISLLGYSSLVEVQAELAAAKQGRSMRFRHYLLSHDLLPRQEKLIAWATKNNMDPDELLGSVPVRALNSVLVEANHEGLNMHKFYRDMRSQVIAQEIFKNIQHYWLLDRHALSVLVISRVDGKGKYEILTAKATKKDIQSAINKIRLKVG